MPTKNREKNSQYVAKSRAKLIAHIGIQQYRKEMLKPNVNSEQN